MTGGGKLLAAIGKLLATGGAEGGRTIGKVTGAPALNKQR